MDVIGSWGNQFGCCFGSRGAHFGGDQIWRDMYIHTYSFVSFTFPNPIQNSLNTDTLLQFGCNL